MRLILLSIYLIDVNECQDISSPCTCAEQENCQANCTNTIGSFNCSCNSGFTLQADQTTCTGT